jgi:hypothetical protein
VVADHGQVVAPQLSAGEPDVACRRGQRLLGVEALVDHLAARAQAVGTLGVVLVEGLGDVGGQLLRALHVDLHVQQVLSGLGEDLGETDRAREVVTGHRVAAPRALEEHHPFEDLGRDVGLGRRALDQRPPARGALCGTHRPAGAAREQWVGVAVVGALDELLLALGVPRERVEGLVGVLAGLRLGLGREGGQGGARRGTLRSHGGPGQRDAGDDAGDERGEHRQRGQAPGEASGTHPAQGYVRARRCPQGGRRPRSTRRSPAPL